MQRPRGKQEKYKETTRPQDFSSSRKTNAEQASASQSINPASLEGNSPTPRAAFEKGLSKREREAYYEPSRQHSASQSEATQQSPQTTYAEGARNVDALQSEGTASPGANVQSTVSVGQDAVSSQITSLGTKSSGQKLKTGLCDPLQATKHRDQALRTDRAPVYRHGIPGPSTESHGTAIQTVSFESRLRIGHIVWNETRNAAKIAMRVSEWLKRNKISQEEFGMAVLKVSRQTMTRLLAYPSGWKAMLPKTRTKYAIMEMCLDANHSGSVEQIKSWRKSKLGNPDPDFCPRFSHSDRQTAIASDPTSSFAEQQKDPLENELSGTSTNVTKRRAHCSSDLSVMPPSSQRREKLDIQNVKKKVLRKMKRQGLYAESLGLLLGIEDLERLLKEDIVNPNASDLFHYSQLMDWLEKESDVAHCK